MHGYISITERRSEDYEGEGGKFFAWLMPVLELLGYGDIAMEEAYLATAF